MMIAIAILSITVNNAMAQKKSKTATAIIKTEIKCDHCKVCETCGKLFDEKLYQLKGIKMVEVNSKDNTIKVVYNSKKISIQQIRESISKLGYDADDIKADPNGYEKLDGCCKPN